MAKQNSLKEVVFRDRHHRWGAEWGTYRTMLEYITPSDERFGETVPNEPFHAILRLMYLERGRSAARFWWQDSLTETMYPMFGQGLVDLLSNVDLLHGYVEGDWIAVKRGANYGIERYEA